MAGINDIVSKIKEQIRETDVDSVHDQWSQSKTSDNRVIIDVRERDEFVDGHIEGADFVPRGLLDLKIENLVPDRDKEIILYCGSGTRSALAAKTLEDLGYNNVASMAGGFTAWKQAGYPVNVAKTLNQEQMSRYSRHLIIPEIGEKGQMKLLDSKVLMLGAGGLGSPAALYLAAAGVGQLGIIDSDVVDRSNLQRQVVHADDRVGEPKVESAKKTIQGLNPDVEVEMFNTRLTSDNVLSIFEGYDLVIDGGDNFPTRYLINDACVHLGIPNVHGSVFRFEGQVTSFVPHDGPCYRCLYPEPPPPEFAPSCQEAGVLGVLPGVIGLLQAIEAVKLLVGIGEPLSGRLLAFDGLKTEFREMKLRRDPKCPACGEDAEFTGFIDYEQFCAVSI
ncbi:molybdopterin-synthase adenylyltransferase MoeB [Persicimonas caeni]|uniref:Molybdopterin-synthase adenylyltransferase MoeB n=1 Tax=Persicimonas caeni TaxID=2292766 RepID=A0A4Y6Q1L1_PERCE|nr:molybdopterin-synthase adenylyltransferase MoeB [Persicimonas caeni]QDG54484.1 molybdopterin-synthase adenylyltransferase MoeB [Persicimonas caeni]QED35705.1 molybdopterin-synthase adenylyltransferase MoeB [Persicimonas caeni]